MSDLTRLTEYRALRDAAWAMVQADIDTLKTELSAHGIGARLKDKAAEEAQEAWDTARDVASEHKGVVAGTILALVAWLLRGPIGSALSSLFADEDEGGAEPADD
ncbi:hypothetical protein [Novosphingobium sp. Gsoil 351]|uniref:hypothetical protein n=1 Tax=Novosphingobium sp. Gsoil 351 TaxID=2675225 RepID=UPI0012B46721|nr:hypothetical protein [Novosphingobium sp. Gsoil 351]QGN53876.1 hypothetical protein GKE62_04350 [Novosphingobium sp. Gsoil 351]